MVLMDAPSPLSYHRPPSLEDKRQLRGNMYKISSDQLGEIVQTLEQQCPEAISKVGWLVWLLVVRPAPAPVRDWYQ